MNKKDVETVEPESAESGFVSELKWIGECRLSQEAEYDGLYIYSLPCSGKKLLREREREREGPRR